MLISVITPVYNGKDVIPRCFQSVVDQEGIDLSQVEHIFVDDGSTDGSSEVLKLLEQSNPHVKTIFQNNAGAAVARNQAIQQAKGKYIVFLDVDDIWLPQKLKAQINFMKSNNCVFSYGDYTEVQSGSELEVIRYELSSKLSYDDLLRGCPIGCLTAAYDQEVLGKIYMPLIRRGQDWGLWLAITRSGVVANKYPGNFANYYIGHNSLSNNKFKKIFDLLRIYRREQNINLFLSLYYLFRHALYFFRKQSRRKAALKSLSLSKNIST